MNSKVLTAVIAVVLVATCAGIIVSIPSGDRDNGPADITIACGNKNCYEPFWIADHYGLFQKYGVNAHMKYFDGGGNAMTSLLNGTTDLTLVGADPAIRMFEKTDAGYAIGTIEISKSGQASNDFAYLSRLESEGFDLDDASTFFDADGNIRVHCGLDTTTGYYSGYVSFLYEQKEDGKITEEQYRMLKTVKTVDRDGGIIHVEFANQVTVLCQEMVEMICSGNAATIAKDIPGISVRGSVEYDSVVGGCVICVSKEVYEQKADLLVKVLKALDEACRMIKDPATVDEVSRYCAEYYGAKGWTAENQKQFFSGYYWDICTMISMPEYLEFKAALINDDYAGHDYSGLVKTDLVVRAHAGVTLYDGMYIYDPEQGRLVPDK